MAWRLAPTTLLRNLQMSDNIEENISNILNLIYRTTIADFQKLLSFYLLWRIWKARNNVVFNNFRESPTNTTLRAQAKTRDWLNATQNQSRVNSRVRPTVANNTKWKTPPVTHMKCNFDATSMYRT